MHGEPLVRWDWVVAHADDLAFRVGEHVLLVALAVGVGFLISLGAGMVVARRRRLARAVLSATDAVYAIPSLALFALLVPVTGLTTLTAEVGLVGYALHILVRSVVEGIESTPAATRDVALGLGHTPRQVLWRVELSLAIPAIVTGLRLATISTIGLATVTALIGQGGIGALVLEGIQRFFPTPMIVGASLLVALALGADALLLLLERRLTPWTRGGR